MRTLTPVLLPGEPTEVQHAASKEYVDTGLAPRPGLPYRADVPAGSASTVITHGLGTLDVDVAVWRTADDRRVGVPFQASTADTVTLTFSTAPTAGQYRVLVSSGLGTAEGGGEVEVGPHASTHSTGGSDPVSAASIGAADSAHDHGATYADDAHLHSGTYQPIGAYATTGHAHPSLYASLGHTHAVDPAFLKPFPPVLLTNRREVLGVGKKVDIDASLGTHFRLDISIADHTSDVDGRIYSYVYLGDISNSVPGQTILLEVATRVNNGRFGFQSIRGTGQTWILVNAVWQPLEILPGNTRTLFTFVRNRLDTYSYWWSRDGDIETETDLGWTLVSRLSGYPI